MEKQKVHVRDLDGKLKYTRLFDDGGPGPLEFESRSGYVDRLDVQRYHWQICPGWPPTPRVVAEALVNVFRVLRRSV